MWKRGVIGASGRLDPNVAPCGLVPKARLPCGPYPVEPIMIGRQHKK